jgi:sugar/nucleoside kinase (ribokinase family)
MIDTAARLGHPAGIIGGVGEDDFGRCLLERFKRDGVDARYVRIFPGYSTAVAFVTYFSDGSRKFLYHIDRTPAATTGFDEKMEAQAGFFHVMGCSLMINTPFREEIMKAMRAFKEKGSKISFDPNIRTELLREKRLEEIAGPVLKNCSVLLPGTAELAQLSGRDRPEESVARLFDLYPLDLIVLKQGKQGCSIFTRGDRQPLVVPAFPIKEVDPTGAGDCFDGGFLCGLLEGKPLDECARMGSAAGALNASAFGPMEGEISRESVGCMTAAA